MVIIWKCMKISNYYVVCQELMYVVYQLYLNKQTNKHRKIDRTCGYQEAGDRGWELDEDSQKVQTFSYKKNSWDDVMKSMVNIYMTVASYMQGVKKAILRGLITRKILFPFL